MEPIPILCGGCGAEIQIDPAMLDTPLECIQCHWPINVKLYEPLVEARREIALERKEKERAEHERLKAARRSQKEARRIIEEARTIEADKRERAAEEARVAAELERKEQEAKERELVMKQETRRGGPFRSVAIIACGVVLGVICLTVMAVFVFGYSRNGKPSITAATYSGNRQTQPVNVTPSLTRADMRLFAGLRAGSLEFVKEALQHEPNLNSVDGSDTPLSLVIRQCELGNLDEYKAWKEMAVGMVKAGADVDANGGAALKEARSDWFIEFLLGSGAKVDGQPSKDTPLYECACDDVWYKKAKILIEHGADPNARNSKSQSPLHNAAAGNAMKVISLLLENKADINARDSKGYTPLKRARLSFQKKAAELLEAQGGVE